MHLRIFWKGEGIERKYRREQGKKRTEKNRKGDRGEKTSENELIEIWEVCIVEIY